MTGRMRAAAAGSTSSGASAGAACGGCTGTVLGLRGIGGKSGVGAILAQVLHCMGIFPIYTAVQPAGNGSWPAHKEMSNETFSHCGVQHIPGAVACRCPGAGP